MLRITQLKLPCGHSRADLERQIRRSLHMPWEESLSYTIIRHSIDARKKPQLFDIYSVDVQTGKSARAEQKMADRLRHRNKNISVPARHPYHFPERGDRPLQHRPIVIGAGPAGLFCALLLAEHGYRPLVLERGRCVEDRAADIERYWKTGRLDPSSNVQFGEGGAGTFSDGKLSTQVNDKSGRREAVLRTFVQAGAPEDILYESKPHIGTDKLREVIPAIRERIIRAGGEVRFETQVTDIVCAEGKVCGVKVKSAGNTGEKLPPDGQSGSGNSDMRGTVLPAEVVVLAPGHSARDTIQTLYRHGIHMEQKPFAVGFRVSHPQSLINQSQYGISDPEKLHELRLPAASYKLTARTASGRGVYSFCMCPGGYIVNASSETGRIAVNGMSDYARNSARANSAIVITVTEREFGSADPLAGLCFQRELEEKAYRLGDGAVPVQRYTDLRKKFAGKTELIQRSKTDDPCTSSEEEPDEKGHPAKSGADLCIRGRYRMADLSGLLPGDLTADFLEGMELFDSRIHGFAGSEAYVAGVESRTSSPVRIPRDENLQSPDAGGLYPCGEGAGYAGGIMSAAMDGIRVAEAIGSRFEPFI